MLKYVVAVLCGSSLAGSVYMAGWGSQKCLANAESGAACCLVSESGSSAAGIPISLAGKVDIGNSKCIVLAEDASTRTVEYQNKLYHVCCDDCVATFNKDPGRYVKALEADPAKYGVPKK